LPRERVDRKDLLQIFSYSFLGVVINQMLFLVGLNMTTPVDSAIILAIVPVAAFVFAAIILRERISLIRASGLVVGLAGIFLLILQEGNPDFGSATFVGNLLTLINSISWALFTVLIKRMLNKYHPVTVMKWVFLFGMMVNVPVGVGQLSTTQWGSIPATGYLGIGFVVVFSTYLGYFLLTFGLKRLSPTIVNTYNYTQPVIAGVVATILGQDTVSLVKVMSAVLIFVGVSLVSRRQKTEIASGNTR
jgi:drug/metabolite transporter (DMT)-like permease